MIAEEARAFVGEEPLAMIIMGNGTNSKTIAKVVQQLYPLTKLHLVGEAHSTEDARTLYWQENPLKGWRRLVPLGLQVPPIPLDAYAADNPGTPLGRNKIINECRKSYAFWFGADCIAFL